MSQIKKIFAREILDSRGWPTVEVDLTLTDDSVGRAAAPAGTSTGEHEATEKRDAAASRYGGRGVTQAVANVNGEIAAALVGQDWEQAGLDQKLIGLDGTPNKSRLGGNAILPISLAFARAEALAKSQPLHRHLAELGGNTEALRLPAPLILILEGGRHAEGGARLQELMIVPTGAPNIHEVLRWGAEIYEAAGKLVKKAGFAPTVGLEGAFAPKFSRDEEGLELILTAIKEAGYTAGAEVGLAVDAAASEFYHAGRYELAGAQTADELIALYESWTKKYPLVSLEDGLAEDDWAGWQKLTATLGEKIQLVGDDLFATNPERLRRGVEQKTANAILIKPNQIGTLSETIKVSQLARANHFQTIISHRSGETEDAFLADLAVGLGVDYVKFGAPNRGERVAKYNQLLRLEESLNEN